MVSADSAFASQITSPATSIRWGATPTPSMYIASPRASLEVMRTPGGIPVMMSRTSSVTKMAAQDKIAEKQAKKEKKGLFSKVKKSINKNTTDYWTNGLNIHYSGAVLRI